MSIEIRQDAKNVLIADGLGCAAAGVLACIPSLYRHVDPTLKTRNAVVAGLGLTSAVCLLGARTNPAFALRAAAVFNAGWVATCLYAAPRQRSWIGRTLVLGTAAFDAAAGYVQLRLSKSENQRNTHL